MSNTVLVPDAILDEHGELRDWFPTKKRAPKKREPTKPAANKPATGKRR